MKFKRFFIVLFLFLLSLPAFLQDTGNIDIATEISSSENSSVDEEDSFFTKADNLIDDILADSPEENHEKEIRINKDILNNNNKELFPNIPNPFYEPDTSTLYDEEPITVFGINARWLSDKLPNHEITHLFSFDFGYTITSWQKNGWGLGLNYEQKIWRYFSVKGTLATTTYHFSDDDLWCTGIEEDISLFCYPFGKGLEWLYVGCGIGADQLFYYNDDTLNLDDSLISYMPVIGWKQIFAKKFMIDLNAGYRMVIYNTENYEDNTDFIRTGFQVGIKIQIFWKRLLKSYVDSVISKKTNLIKKRQQTVKVAASKDSETD